MAQISRAECTPERIDAAYKYLGIKRSQLIEEILVTASALANEHDGAAPSDGTSRLRFRQTTKNDVLGLPSEIDPVIHPEFNRHIDSIIFHLVRSQKKTSALTTVFKLSQVRPVSTLILSQLGIKGAEYVRSPEDIHSLTREAIRVLAYGTNELVRLHGRTFIVTMRAVLNLTDHFSKLPEKLPSQFSYLEKTVKTSKQIPEVKPAAEAVTRRTALEDEILKRFGSDPVFKRRVKSLLRARPGN